MSNQMTLPVTPNVTSSLVLEGGHTLSSSLDGQKANESGLALVPVSRSVAQESLREFSTKGIYGQLFNASSPSARLQLSLENKLRQRMDVNGSLEYALTWKTWDMQSGVPICALRALARRISASDFTGWRTPTAGDAIRGVENNPKDRNSKAGTGSLNNEAALAGWCSPTAQDHSRGDKPPRETDTGIPLSQQAAMVSGWATPTGRDHKDGSNVTGVEENNLLGRQVHGAITNSVTSQTEKRGALNPALSRWLQGYPVTWCQAAIRAFRKFKPARNSASHASGVTETP